MSAPYPHLAPALQRLEGDTLRIWGDATERARAFTEMIERWRAGDNDHALAGIARMSGAIREGLQVLGFVPSQVAKGYEVREGYLGWFARMEDETLTVAGDLVASLLRKAGGADRAFRTFVHETVHLRHERSSNAASEQGVRGYEEGFTEGLARLLVHRYAGIPFQTGNYNYFVAAHRVLVQFVGVEEGWYFRQLWLCAPGDLRTQFPRVIARLYMEAHGHTIGAEQLSAVTGVADALFSDRRLSWLPNEPEMMSLMRRVAG